MRIGSGLYSTMYIYLTDVLPQGLVKGCSQEDYGWKAGCPGNEFIEERSRADIRHTMERLGPPLIRGQPKPGDPIGLVTELGDLLSERHAPDQVLRPRAVGQRRVAEQEPRHVQAHTGVSLRMADMGEVPPVLCGIFVDQLDLGSGFSCIRSRRNNKDCSKRDGDEENE